MLTDLMQNIYGRIAQLGQSIKSLQDSLDKLNATLNEKVGSLVASIKSISQTVEKEGETQKLAFEDIREAALKEINALQERIGKKDMNEIHTKLLSIVENSQEALKPETVDVIIREILDNINKLKEIKDTRTEEEKAGTAPV
jgi:hypothetical protein